MADLKKEARQHLDKTTNTIILDYVLWLSARTILDEASSAPSQEAASRSKGRRLVGLADGLILTFDNTSRPKFSYELLSRRISLASLVILFVYRDSRARYITRRSSEITQRPRSSEAARRTAAYLSSCRSTSVLSSSPSGSTLAHQFTHLNVSETIRRRARVSLGLEPHDPDPQYRNPSLLDALEEFMSVSASSYAQSSTHPAELWIQIASKFCLMAAIEGYLVNGATGLDTLNQCFSFVATDAAATTTTTAGAGVRGSVQGLFEHSRSGAFREFRDLWNAEREHCLALLHPPQIAAPDKSNPFAPTSSHGDENTSSSSDDNDDVLAKHLLSLLQSLSFATLHRQILHYLSAVLEDMDPPDLCRYAIPESPIDRSILRAPGMISIAHEEEGREGKRRKVVT